MKRSLTLTLLLATMFTLVACGGSETVQSGRSAPAEPQQTRAEPAAQSSPEESAGERVPADDEAAESEQGPTQEGAERADLSVTTLEDEEVKLGGQGNVTALYFMAGW